MDNRQNSQLNCSGQRVLVLTDRAELPAAWMSLPEVTILRRDQLSSVTAAATECRIEILRIIREKQPDSLYELAKLVGKNQAYIYRESKALVELGLLEFEKVEGEGRRRTKPIALFDALILWI
jgi:predicted transcriptional regulator